MKFAIGREAAGYCRGFEYKDPLPGFGKIRRTDEAVMTGTDND